MGVERREDILRVATEEFAANGYRGASLAQIAEKVGLTQAGLLHHFSSKSALLIAVLRRRDDVDADTYALLEIDHSAGGAFALFDRLVSLVEANVRRRGIVQLFAVIVGEAVTDDHPARDWAQARYATIRDALVQALQKGVEEGAIRSDADPALVSTQVFALMDGLQTQWLLDESVDMVAPFEQFVRLLKADLATG